MAFFNLSFLVQTNQLSSVRNILKGIGEQSYVTFNALSRSMSVLDKATGRTLGNFSRFLGGGGIMSAGIKAINYGLYQSNSLMTTNKILLEEMMGSAGKAEGFIKKVQDISGSFGQDVSEMMTASRGLTQMFNQIGKGTARPEHLEKMLKLVTTASMLDTENRGLAYTAFSFKEALQGIGQGDWRSMKNRLEINLGKKQEKEITAAVKKGDLDSVVRLFDEAFKRIGINSDKILKRLMNEGLTQGIFRTMSYMNRTMQMMGESSYRALARPFAQLNTFLAMQFEENSPFMQKVKESSEKIRQTFILPFQHSFNRVFKSFRANFFQIFDGLRLLGKSAITTFSAILAPAGMFFKGIFGFSKHMLEGNNQFAKFATTAEKVAHFMEKIGDFMHRIEEPAYRLGSAFNNLIVAVAKLFNVKMSGQGAASTVGGLMDIGSSGINLLAGGINAGNAAGSTTLLGMLGGGAIGGLPGMALGGGAGLAMKGMGLDTMVNIALLASLGIPLLRGGKNKGGGVGRGGVSATGGGFEKSSLTEMRKSIGNNATLNASTRNNPGATWNELKGSTTFHSGAGATLERKIAQFDIAIINRENTISKLLSEEIVNKKEVAKNQKSLLRLDAERTKLENKWIDTHQAHLNQIEGRAGTLTNPNHLGTAFGKMQTAETIGSMSKMEKMAGFMSTGLGTGVNAAFGASLAYQFQNGLKTFFLTPLSMVKSPLAIFATGLAAIGVAFGTTLLVVNELNKEVNAWADNIENLNNIENEKNKQSNLRLTKTSLDKHLGGRSFTGLTDMFGSGQFETSTELATVLAMGKRQRPQEYEAVVDNFTRLYQMKKEGKVNPESLSDSQRAAYDKINTSGEAGKDSLKIIHEFAKLSDKDFKPIADALLAVYAKRIAKVSDSSKSSAPLNAANTAINALETGQ